MLMCRGVHTGTHHVLCGGMQPLWAIKQRRQGRPLCRVLCAAHRVPCRVQHILQLLQLGHPLLLLAGTGKSWRRPAVRQVSRDIGQRYCGLVLRGRQVMKTGQLCCRPDGGTL